MGLRGLQSREEVFLLSPLQFHQVLGIAHLNERPGHIPNVCSGGHFVSLLLLILPSPCTFSCSSPCPTSFLSGQCSLSCPHLKSLLTPFPTILQCSLPRLTHPAWFQAPGNSFKQICHTAGKTHFSNVIGYIYILCSKKPFQSPPKTSPTSPQDFV